MFKAIKAFTLGLAAVVAVMGAAPASATPLAVGNFVVVNDYKFTLTQCSTASCTNGSFDPFGTSIKITGNSAPFATQAAGTYSDTTLVFTVETLDGAFLNGLNLSIDGTAASPGDTNIGASIKNFFSPNLPLYSGANINVDGIGSGQVATVGKSFSGTTNKAILTVDVATQPAGASAAVTNNVVISVTKVPEPMSMLLFSPGVVAVMAVRRRRRALS